ncbi:hypothetical protein [Leptothrix discophora]|uniref:Uncharacterized protein n=1 Tax=Leptothrix discophora TaxID=89 RepID=A0ABT9G1K0_LEPDI|nr:hypothetical protein [Leptothrix discophora]MDP4300364.1 hypothetical protein [Leptothrix discophora]
MELDPLDISAVLTAQRFLLEQLYGNAFAGKPAEFRAFMTLAIERTRTASTVAEPTARELQDEIAARTAANLERFGNSVMQRILKP